MLSKNEKDRVAQLYAKTGSIMKVVRITGYHRDTVRRVIRKLPEKKMGRPVKIGEAGVRRIKRYVEKEVRAGHRVTARVIQEDLNLEANRRTINKTLKKNGITYSVVKKQLPLSKFHKVCRLNFALQHLDLHTDFTKWIFTDEKRFNFDGPDNVGSYGTPNARLKRIKRQMGGGSVMVLGAICSNGNMKVKVIPGKYKSEDYIKDLKATFLPWAKAQMGQKGWTWQQDNCRVHTAKATMAFFSKSKVAVAQWPARSPDLNLIENVWKVLQDEVHRYGQFYDKGTLERRILECTERIDKEMIQDLYSGMGRRLEKVKAAFGAEI